MERNRLDQATRVGKTAWNVIINALLACGLSVIVWNQFFAKKPQAGGSGIDYKAGESVKVPGTEGEPSIVLVTSSTCQYCTKSMPFYKRLVQMTEREGIKLIPVAARGDTPEQNVAYFKEHGIDLKATPVVSDNTDVRVVPTPSLFLMYKGKVVTYHKGMLASTRAEDDFMIRAHELKKQVAPQG